MPRFGHHAFLTPEQISHVVALLLDPGLAGQQVSLAETRVPAPAGARRGRRRQPAPGIERRPGRGRVVRRAALRQRQPAALHRLPRAAAADLLSRAERQPRRRRSRGKTAASGRRGAAAPLRHCTRQPPGACAYPPRFRARGPALRQGRRLRAPRHAGETPALGTARTRCCSTAATPGRARRSRCGRKAPT